jgi:diacylglycerol kinase family enzyme
MPRSGRNGIIIAANPYSGRGSNRPRVDALAAALSGHGLAARVLWEPAERAAVLGEGEPGRTVIAVGGDGTVAEIINEAPGAAVAVLAAGNENIFARALGFPAHPVALAAAVAAGATHAIDLGRVSTTVGGRTRTRLFSLMLSAGFDAEIVHRVARWRGAGPLTRRVGHRSYVSPIARSLLAYRHPRLTLRVDGGTVDAAWCLVSNVPDYALGLRLAAAARPDDGRLDWIAFERAGVAPLAHYTWAAYRGRHLACAGARAGTATRMQLDSAAPVPVQVDGDPWGMTPVDVETLPGALRVISCRPLSRGE